MFNDFFKVELWKGEDDFDNGVVFYNGKEKEGLVKMEEQEVGGKTLVSATVISYKGLDPYLGGVVGIFQGEDMVWFYEEPEVMVEEYRGFPSDIDKVVLTFSERDSIRMVDIKSGKEWEESKLGMFEGACLRWIRDELLLNRYLLVRGLFEGHGLLNALLPKEFLKGYFDVVGKGDTVVFVKKEGGREFYFGLKPDGRSKFLMREQSHGVEL